MKRTLENAIGSARSIFQPVPQKPRVDAPSAPSYPSTRSPGLGVGQPVMKSIAPRVPVYIIQQNFSNSSSPVSTPPQKAISSFDQERIAAKANELRSAIQTSNSDVILDILSDQDASEIAVATDDQGKNALFYAIQKNDILTMDYLCSLTSSSKLVMQQSKSGMFPLCLAAGMGAVVAVIRILGINVENKHIYPDGIPFNPLVNAAAKGHEAVIKILLESPYGAALAQGETKEGFNALAMAACHGHAGVVRTLLASAHAPELTQSSPDKQINAMLAAAGKGHESVVNILLASPYAAAMLQGKNGSNALMVAAQRGHEGVVRVLLTSDYGQALVKQRNKDGLNALMFAAFKNQAAVTCTLLEFGFVEEQLAGIYCERSTIDNVIKKGFLTVAEVLLRYGAVATQSKAGDQSITPTDPGQ
jgi:ankyrin repeat protein